MNLLKSRIYCGLFLISFFLTPQLIESQTHNEVATGIQLFETKKYLEAKKFFESYAKSKNTDPVGAYYLGKLWLREGNYDKAIDWLDKAVAGDEKNAEYHLWLGRAYGVKAQRAGLLKKASAAKNVKKHFERAVELNPENLDARTGLMQFYLMAPGIVGGSKDKAREQAQEINKLNESQGHLAFGFIHAINEEYDLATKEYQAAIQADSRNFQAYYSLGYLYARQKHYDRASEVFENLLKSNPEEVASYFHLGRLAVMSGKNLEKGEQNLKKYLQTEPSDDRPSFAFAHLLLGHIYRMQEKKDLARSEYEKALKLDPDFEMAKKAVKEL